MWALALALAFQLRFEFHVPAQYSPFLGLWLPVLLAFRTLAFYQAGLFRGLWRYTGAPDLVSIVRGTTLATAVFAAALYATSSWLPRSIIAIEWLTSLVMVGGVRFAARTIRPERLRRLTPESAAQRILIVGAGDAGEMLVREIQQRHSDRWLPVAFLDDDQGKRGGHIHGVRVEGTIADLARVVAKHDAREVLIAIPSATGAQMRRVVEQCKRAGVRFKTIPGLDSLIDGRLAMNQLRDVAIEDLLGRDPVQLDMDAISHVMAGQVVMVSGAGGSIGSEICRQVCRFGPAALVLVEHGENNLFHIHRELLARFPEIALAPCIADVGDEARMAAVFEAHRPAVVFHAAAHKHVPMMEWNPGEAVKNNVFGTRTLADLADRFGTGRFVMISTDKAVNPTSVMGASKRVAEIYVQALSQRSRTRFVTVRFGNVLGSAGSVIPIFKEQIASGGPITVTHPDMQRYFMTIPEASQLVLQAGAMGEGGEIFILDMGEPVKIADLARDLVTLSGLEPDLDIEIQFTGVRPGEKLFEELSVDSENAGTTKHPKIFVGRFRPCAWEFLQRQLKELAAVADRPKDVRRKFHDIVPEYRGSGPMPLAAPTPVPVAIAANE
jgi:FlaA1/EpsC-like NDP-sugar epimerase